MTTIRLKLLLNDFGVVRLWRTWARNNIVNTVVKRCIRERGIREVIQCFKHAILKPRRTLLLSATAAYKCKDKSYTCDQGISDEEIQALVSELQHVQKLAKLTLYCIGCGKRLMIDRKQNGVHYCGCKDPQPAEQASDGWVPYIEAQDVIIWRKEYVTGKGLYAYKVYGRYPEVMASDFAAVQVDGAYRRAWDSAVASLAVVQRDVADVAGQTVLHWEVLWPRLFANRDYVYIRRHKEFDETNPRPRRVDVSPIPYESSSVHAKAKRKSLENYAKTNAEAVKNKVFVIVSKSCEHPAAPETKHAIRVSEYWSHMVVRSLDGVDSSGMEFVLTYYDEPAVGGMPGGVAAWASSRAAPVYLERMRRAASEYRSWAADHHQDLPEFTPFGPDQVTEDAVQVQEQDMESSKDGPEMENGRTTRDQGTQTDTQRAATDDVPREETQDVDKETRLRRVIEKCPDDGTPGKSPQGPGRSSSAGESVKTPLGDEKSTAEDTEGPGASDDEEASGRWWRYLYPFYYFV